MDEQLRICLWIVGCGTIGAVLGGAFGALTGFLYNQGGGAAGTRFGRWVADSFTRTAEQEPSPVTYAVLVGAADGFLFLGIVGTLAGTAVALLSNAEPRWLGLAALGSALLVGGAVFFGTLAYAMTRHGARATVCILGGGLIGSILAGSVLGVNDTLYGTLPGFLIGLALSFLTRRYTPSFRPPDVGEPAVHPRSDADAIRKPDDEVFRKSEGEPGV
jgi:hypothetical protein